MLSDPTESAMSFRRGLLGIRFDVRKAASISDVAAPALDLVIGFATVANFVVTNVGSTVGVTLAVLGTSLEGCTELLLTAQTRIALWKVRQSSAVFSSIIESPTIHCGDRHEN
jgi:hypothetical protein